MLDFIVLNNSTEANIHAAITYYGILSTRLSTLRRDTLQTTCQEFQVFRTGLRCCPEQEIESSCPVHQPPSQIQMHQETP